jgi:hypothetical protein
MPKGFHPYAVGACFITVGVAAARPHGRALNLFDLSADGNYGFTRVLHWPDFAGSSMTVDAQVTTKGDIFKLDAAYQGTYDGPTDLDTVLQWEGILSRQADTLDVAEAGRALVRRQGGSTFEVRWDATYRGFKRAMMVPRQRGTMTADLLTFANNTMRLRWTSDMFEAVD